MPWLFATLNPIFRGFAMKRIDGNRFGSSVTLASLVVPLSTTKVSQSSRLECCAIDASASAVVSHAFQLTRTMERSGAMWRLYRRPVELASVRLEAARGENGSCCAVARRTPMDNEREPNRQNEEAADANEEAITGRADEEADGEEEFEDTEDADVDSEDVVADTDTDSKA